MPVSQSVSERIEQLHRCYYIEEIVDWLNENKEFLGQHFDCAAPPYLAINKFKNFPDLNRWSFYLWVSDSTLTDEPNTKYEPFIRLLDQFGFKVHWIFSIRFGSDAYISMEKSDWKFMSAYERLST